MIGDYSGSTPLKVDVRNKYHNIGESNLKIKIKQILFRVHIVLLLELLIIMNPFNKAFVGIATTIAVTYSSFSFAIFSNSMVPATAEDIAGKWILTSIDQHKPFVGDNFREKTPTLDIKVDSSGKITVDGHATCNGFSARTSMDGSTLGSFFAAMTRASCGSEAGDAQEYKFMSILRDQPEVYVDSIYEHKIEFSSNEGHLIFHRKPQSADLDIDYTIGLDTRSKNFSKETESGTSSVFFWFPRGVQNPNIEFITGGQSDTNERRLWQREEGYTVVYVNSTDQNGVNTWTLPIRGVKQYGKNKLALQNGLSRNFGRFKFEIDQYNEEWQFLPSGTYRGSFIMKAQGWHDENFTKTIEVKFKVVKD